MGCADSEIVAAWISDRLAPEALAQLEAHADRCEACLQLLAAIGRVCADPRSREIHHTHGAPVLADWAMLAAAPGGAIGRYELVGVLGRGGFGVVYEARDRELGRDVAIKALFAAADAVNAAAIRSEARALAALNHPNVVRLYDVVETGGRVYLVMELVRGTTMRAWQRDRSTAEIVERYLAAAAGLSAIHDVGLVHADVKPDNLLVTPPGVHGMRVLVTDFGLARAVATTGDVAGTLRYMAPEQRAGARVSASADQYAWCVALWEALHRALPDERPLRLAPARVRSVLRRGLAARPSDRWPSMHALALALRVAMRPRRRWWALAAGLGLAGATASIAAFAAPSPRAPVDVQAVDASHDPMPELAAEIERIAARRDRGDLVGAMTALLPIADGEVIASPPLRIRATQELARALAGMGYADDAQSRWHDAHAAAAAEHADLLAAAIALDLAQHESETPDTLERAQTWLRTAEAELRRIEIDPAEYADVVFATARIAAANGRMREAAEGLARAAALPAGADEASRIRILIEWGSVLGRLGEHERGLARIAEGHALCDASGLVGGLERVELHRTAATLLQNLGRFDDAVREMERALAIADGIRGFSRGHRSSLHGDLGIFHLQLGHRDETGEHLKLALELAPESWVAHSNLSIWYGKIACRNDVPTPGCDPSARELGYVHQLRAVELARAAFGESHPTFATMRANLARERLDRGELQRALEDYDQSCTELELHFGAEAHQLLNPLYGLVEVNVRMGRREPAARAAERLYTVAHAPALASRKDAIAVLDYVVGRTLAWQDSPDERATELVASGRSFFGDHPPDDFMLIDGWFDGRTPPAAELP